MKRRSRFQKKKAKEVENQEKKNTNHILELLKLKLILIINNFHIESYYTRRSSCVVKIKKNLEKKMKHTKSILW